MENLTTNMALKEQVIMRNFTSVKEAELFSPRGEQSGLFYRYYGGIYNKSDGVEIVIANGSIALTASATNWIYFNVTTNAVAVITGATSAVVPAGNILIYKVVTNSTGIDFSSVDNFVGMRKFFFLPQGTSNSGGSSGGGGTDVVTQKLGKITAITGLSVTIQRSKAIIQNKPDYSTANVTTSASSDVALSLTANTKGYIYLTGASPFVAFVSGTTATNALSSKNVNMSALLYYYETNATSVTAIEDISNQSLQRLIDTYSTTIEVSGNLSKVNTFTIPTNTFNTSLVGPNYYYDVWLRCKTAELGYAVGDFTSTGMTGNISNHNEDMQIQVTTTGSDGKGFSIILDEAVKVQSKTTFKKINVTPANWQIVVRARSPM